MSEIKKPGIKMKVTGYVSIAFAAVISIMILFTTKITAAEGLPIVYYWGGLGVTLLFGNAGKRIGGQLAINKTEAK